jgi:Cu2+-containing amine oxidase
MNSPDPCRGDQCLPAAAGDPQAGQAAALAWRGITDLSMVQVDAWPASNFGLEVDKSGRRECRL